MLQHAADHNGDTHTSRRHCADHNHSPDRSRGKPRWLLLPIRTHRVWISPIWINSTSAPDPTLGQDPRVSPIHFYASWNNKPPSWLEWCCVATRPVGIPPATPRAGGTAAEQPVRTSRRRPYSPVRRKVLRSLAYLDQQDYHSASIACEGVPTETVARLRVAVQLGPCMKRGNDCSAAPQASAPAFAAVATQVLAHHTLVICGTAYWLDQRKMQSGCLEGLEVSLATPLTTSTANAMGQSATWIYTPRQDEMAPMRRY